MQRMRGAVAVGLFVGVVGCTKGAEGPPQAPKGDMAAASASAPAPKAPQEVAEPASPPAVLTGTGHLDCTISSKENGTQKLVIQDGQGLEFDAVVSPIVDGVVQQK